jgi:hypothetical protein
MTKEEVINQIKQAVGSIYSNGKFTYQKSEKDFYKEEEPKEKIYFLAKFPNLKSIIISLLTPSYSDFIEDIHWVSPKPTTFKVVLHNGQFFYLKYTNKSWIAQVEGKNYYLSNVSNEQQATESISRILRYPSSGLTKTTETPSEKETPPETPPTEEK